MRLSSSTIYGPGRMASRELNPTVRSSTPKTLDERPSRFAPNWPSRSLPSIGNRGWPCCGRFTKIVCAPDQVIATLLQGSLGHIHIARFVSFPTPTKSFGDVGWDGDRRSSHLQRQAVCLLLRERGRERVDRQHQLVCFAPHHKVLKSPCRSSGDRHKQRGVHGSMLQGSDPSGGFHERLLRTP